MKRLQTILLVEDCAEFRRFVASLLRDNGYRVLDVGSGRDALDVASQHPSPIHVLLSDLILAGPMDGLELAWEMQRTRPETRTIFMSGYAGTFADRLELEALSDFFLAKPFTAKVLLGALEACLAAAPAAPARPGHPAGRMRAVLRD